MSLHIIILAAGNGTRMRSKVPKVLHQLGGKPLLEHVLKTAQSLQPEKIHIVCGKNVEAIREHFCEKNLHWLEQKEKLGTGHAVMQALDHIKQASQVLVLYGDVPLISADTLQQLRVNMPPSGLSLLSAKLSDPTGLGRIIRDSNGKVTAIIEHKDASPEQRQLQEINTGILATTVHVLSHYLPRLEKHNAQGEYYLTDIIAMLYADHVPLACILAANPEEVSGVNDQKQLAHLERQYQKNLSDDLMSRGLVLMDPARFDVRGELTVGNNVVIDVNVVIEGRVTIGSDTTIGPNNFLKNVQIGENVTIKANCVIEDAKLSDNCIVGPFARIRPNSFLDQGAHVGNFVEVKNTRLGKNSKANHLSYLGDAVVGNEVNIGAGTITCNYDGVEKYQTTIEDGVFVGSNASLVAPVTLGTNTVIGAGSVITQNTPGNKLTVARARQITVEGWQRNKKLNKT